MGIANLQHISENLIKEGKDKNTPVAFISWATRYKRKYKATNINSSWNSCKS